MVKKTNKTVKIATYGALLAVFSGAITTPVSAATASNADNVKVETTGSAVTKPATTTNAGTSSVVKPADISGITWGDMSYSGSAASGLTVHNGVTSGELSFSLDVTSLASVSFNDKTYFRVKLPEEFRALAQTSAFRSSLSGRFQAWNLGGILKVKDHNYSSSEIRVDSAKNELLFTNPAVTGVGILGKTTMDVTMNLGQAINSSGVHIADSSDGYYHAQSALAGDGNIIDWTIGNRESEVDIPLRKMDPGAGESDNSRPEINTSAKNTTISINSNFDNAEALKNVTAYDKEDGDITRKIIVTSNTVDTSKVGYYVVAYSVYDSKGLEAQASIMMHVVDDRPAKDYSLAPNSYKLGDSTLTGTYGKDVSKVRLFIDGKVVSQATTKNGAFTFNNADKYVTSKKQNVEVVAVDSSYVEQNRKVVTVTGEEAKDYSLTPNEYKLGSSELTGHYGKDVSKVRLFIDGTVVTQATTSKGYFTFKDANKFVTSKKQKVEVVAVDGAYKEQNRKTVTVTGEEAKDYSLTANTYKIGTTKLTGTYGKDVSRVRLFVDGTVVTQATTSNGTFTVDNANKFIKNKNQKVEVVAVDGAYKEQNRKTVSVIADPVKDYALSANAYKIGDANVTGTYGKDVAKVRLFINGSVVAQATTSNGTFTIKNANKFITSKNQKVEVVAVDDTYKEQNRKTVSVSGEITNDYSLTANTYNLGTSKLTGTYGKDVAKVRLFVNGVVVSQATLDGAGNYTFTNVDKFVTENEDTIQVKAVNSQYEEVNSINVNKNGSIVHDYKLTANDYSLDQSTITGTQGADIAKVRIRVNGQIVKQADLSNGTYTAKGMTGLIKMGDKVEAVGVNAQYKEVATAVVNVSEESANHDYSLSAPNTFQIGTDVVQGTYGTDLKAVRLLVNGKTIKNADLNSSTHIYTLKGLAEADIKAGDKLEVVGVDSSYKQQVSKVMSVVE